MKAAVVGLGIGMAHVAGYLESPYADLYAVCDLIPERLNVVGGTFREGSMLCLKPLFKDDILDKSWEEIGVKTFTSLDALLADPEVEMISLCTPDYLHAEHAGKVLRAGKHLLLEKPLDIDFQKALTISDDIINSDKSFGLEYEFRVNPAVLKMKELVESGDIGEVKAFSLYHFRTPFRSDKWENWIQDKKKSGGLIIEETCHWIDLARYITGKEIYSVHCVTEGGILPEVIFENVAYINGTYRDGGIFQISHILTGFDFSLQLTLHGTIGTVWCGLKDAKYSVLDNGETTYQGIVCFGKPDKNPNEVLRWTWGEEAAEPWNIKEMVKSFVEKAVYGLPQIAGLVDGIESLKWAINAQTSALENRIISR